MPQLFCATGCTACFGCDSDFGLSLHSTFDPTTLPPLFSHTSSSTFLIDLSITFLPSSTQISSGEMPSNYGSVISQKFNARFCTKTEVMNSPPIMTHRGDTAERLSQENKSYYSRHYSPSAMYSSSALFSCFLRSLFFPLHFISCFLYITGGAFDETSPLWDETREMTHNHHVWQFVWPRYTFRHTYT